MTRFECIGNTMVNVDKIRTYYRIAADPDILIVELDNGEVYKAQDKFCRLEERLEGRDFITQVIPCLSPLYAMYKDDGKMIEYPVYYLALCADGYVRPLDIYEDVGVDFADGADNYVGLFSSKKGEIDEDNDTRPHDGH